MHVQNFGMASFHTVRLACFDGKSVAFNKFNVGSGYKAQGSRPDKVALHIVSSLFEIISFSVFIFLVSCLCPLFLVCSSQSTMIMLKFLAELTRDYFLILQD